MNRTDDRGHIGGRREGANDVMIEVREGHGRPVWRSLRAGTTRGDPEEPGVAPASVVRHPRIYFSSTDQYALSRSVFHDWYFLLVSFRFSIGLRFGFSGRRIRAMWACFGVRPPLRTLQSMHAQTMFS